MRRLSLKSTDFGVDPLKSTHFGVDPKFIGISAAIPHKERLSEWKAFILKP